MTKRLHRLNPDLELLRQINYILPKLRHSISILKIFRWLENFNLSDVHEALDFLFYLEYIDTNELIDRLDFQLNRAIKLIPQNNNIIILPGAASYPKSPEIINYLIKKTPTYDKYDERITITREIKTIRDIKTPTALIIADDFVGSGKTFRDAYDLKNQIKTEADKQILIQKRILVCPIIMDIGEQFIKFHYPEITICAETRYSIFNFRYSPLHIKNRYYSMKNIAEKYGKGIYYEPLGFDKSGALIVFNHSTPDNTLPIIWSHENWNPIFPRHANSRIKESRLIKKEASYYIGLMNRLGLDLFDGSSIKVGSKRIRKYNNYKNHALLCVMKLTRDGYDYPSICQILGYSSRDYDEILKYGKTIELLNSNGQFTQKGFESYAAIQKKYTPKKRFLNRGREKFQLKNIVYVPKTLRGKS